MLDSWGQRGGVACGGVGQRRWRRCLLIRGPSTSVRHLRQMSMPPGMVRRFVVVRVRAWGLDEVEDVARLVASELVTNAVRHAASGSGKGFLSAVAGGPVCWSWCGAWARFAVDCCVVADVGGLAGG